MDVCVAASDHDVGQLAVGYSLDQPTASSRIAIPFIQRIADDYAVRLLRSQRHHEHLLGKKIPASVIRSEEHTSELQSLMRISYAVFCLKKKNIKYNTTTNHASNIH